MKNKSSDAKEFLKKGNKAFEKKEYGEAVNFYEKAILIDSDYENAWENKGWAHYEKGEYDKAKRCWERLLSINLHHHPVIEMKLQVLQDKVQEEEESQGYELQNKPQMMKQKLQEKINTLIEEEKMLDLREIETALEGDEIERAETLLEDLEEKYKKYKETIEELESLDERKSSLAAQLADEKIDRDTYNDAVQNIEYKKAELEEKLNRLREEVLYEDYEKPF